MQVTKKIIAPLLIMVLLAGIAGVMSAREMSIRREGQMKSIDTIINPEQESPEESESLKTEDLPIAPQIDQNQ